MKSRLRFPFWAAMAAIVMTAAIGSAHATSPYDGSWSVIITTVRGACSSGSGFGLQIRDGAVYGGGGGFSVGGPRLAERRRACERRFRPAACQRQRTVARQLWQRLVARRWFAGRLFGVLERQPQIVAKPLATSNAVGL
jgi:hypothetical protein